jgi:hypothetical protein
LSPHLLRATGALAWLLTLPELSESCAAVLPANGKLHAHGGGVDLLAVERLQERDGLGEARLEFGDRRLVILVVRRFGAGRWPAL